MSTPPSQEYIDEDRGWKLIATASAFVPICIFFVAVRFYGRYLAKVKHGLDDYLTLLSLGLQIGFSALSICFVIYGGVGRHEAAWEELDPPKMTAYYKYILAVSFYYSFCVGWPKLAALALYLRLFPSKMYRYCIYLIAAVVLLNGIIGPAMALSLCHPFEYNWNRTIPGHCLNEPALTRWGSLPNIVTDVAMLVLPLSVVWKLHSSMKLKMGLTITFAIGSVGLTTSILRFTYFFQASAYDDGTWASVDLMIWSIVETDTYLIAGCLLTFRPVFVHCLQGTRFLSKVSQDDYTSSDGGQTVRLSKAKTASQDYHHAAGFRCFDKGRDGFTGTSYEDNIALVTVAQDGNKDRRSDISADKILVHNEYDVRLSSAGK